MTSAFILSYKSAIIINVSNQCALSLTNSIRVVWRCMLYPHDAQALRTTELTN